MQKRNIIRFITVTAAGGLVWGAGPAMALETPKSTTAETPYVSVPLVSTPALTTPGESVSADVDAIELPAGASIYLNGEVGQEISTPESTPDLSQSVDVPSLDVDRISAGGQGVDSQKANVDMPASASADESDATMNTADNEAGTTMGWTDSSWDVEASAADRDASVGAELG